MIVETAQRFTTSMSGEPEGNESAVHGNGTERESGEAAFEALFVMYYPRIAGALLRLLGDASQAEELANDVFWRAYRQKNLAHDGNIGGWLYRTAMNLGIDALRANARRRHHEHAAAHEALPGGGMNPLSEVLRQEKCRRVREVLARLKPAQAAILILRASGLSYQELAGCLGVKRGGIGTMLNRAEAEFERRYRQMHGSEEV